jgi:hypothetical protein
MMSSVDNSDLLDRRQLRELIFAMANWRIRAAFGDRDKVSMWREMPGVMIFFRLQLAGRDGGMPE